MADSPSPTNSSPDARRERRKKEKKVSGPFFLGDKKGPDTFLLPMAWTMATPP
jgi:hypothetical protein